MSKHKKVFVGLSGGVDSSVAAALLQAQGYDVTGVYMKNWSADIAGTPCPWRDDLASARSVAAHLNIPFKVYDFEADYKRAVVDYMVESYQKGLTPNPDVMCNQEIKFKVFARKCFDEGADLIATGHYARIGSRVRSNSPACHPDPPAGGEGSGGLKVLDSSPALRMTDGTHAQNDKILAKNDRTTAKNDRANMQYQDSLPQSDKPDCHPEGNQPEGSVLLRAKDKHKDQTYFLYRMNREVAKRTLFPLGDYTKPQVRELAREHNLPTAERRDSQGLCFVGKVPLRDFLSQYIKPKTGDIVDENGHVVGQHDGAFYYTIGQRHGLGVGGGQPYFVYKKDSAKNIIYVTTDPASAVMQRDKFAIADCAWWSVPQPGAEYKVRLRHGGALLPAKLTRLPDDKYELKLKKTERAIAPGQSAVIYDGELVLGGGVIEWK